MNLPSYIFIERDKETTIVGESDVCTQIVSGNFENGIWMNYDGAEFSMKGVATPEILYSVNIVKSLFVEALKIRPTLNSLVSAFVRFSNKVLNPYLLKPEYRTAGTKEFDGIILSFLVYSGLERSIASQFSRNFSHLFEYDNAYRLRLVDIATETDKYMLSNYPIRELRRLFKIMKVREVQHKGNITRKLGLLFNVVVLLLLIPKYRKAFKKAILESNWENMQFDNTDRYWAYLRKDYDFCGMSYEVRMATLRSLGYSLPIQKPLMV